MNIVGVVLRDRQGQPGQGGKSHDSPGDAARERRHPAQAPRSESPHDGAELIGESPGRPSRRTSPRSIM